MRNPAPTKWLKAKLGDVIVTLTDYHANGSYKKLKENVELLDEPNYAVMIRTTNFEQKDFTDDLKFITKEAYEFLSKSKVKPKDILMNKIANAGSVYLMPDLHRPVSLAMNLFLIRTDPNSTDQRYIYYYLKLNEAYIKGFAIGTATATITKDAVRKLDIIIPPLLIQRHIALILSTYDNLIENNTRRIQILEEMARRIYEEWFVNLRFPGHEAVPMVGGVPEGWKDVSFTDVADVLSGGTPKTTTPEYWNGAIPFFTPKDAKSDYYVLDTIQRITELGLSRCNSRLYPKDTVFITARGTVGKVALAAVDMAMNQSCYALKTKDNISQLYLFLLTQSCIDRLRKNTGGATFDTIVVDTFKRLKVMKPPTQLINNLHHVVSPIFAQILNLLKKIKNLRQTHDLLLPKLISGEIDVSHFPDPDEMAA